MESSRPIQVGVTGGIGSGKSVVCQLFRCLGVPVYAADDRARWLTNHLPVIREEVIDLLGPQSYTEQGTYNRTYVASRVFSDSNLLQSLNRIIHPRVAEDTEVWLAQHQRSPYVVKEAALMNKAGDNNTLDYVIVVSAPFQLRLARIKLRDPKRPEEEIKAIIQSQRSDASLRELADFIIENDEDSALIPQVLTLHEFFLQKHQG